MTILFCIFFNLYFISSQIYLDYVLYFIQSAAPINKRYYKANAIKYWGYRVELIVGLTHPLVVERP